MTPYGVGAVLAGVRRIDGLELACVVDAATGSIMESVPDGDDAALPVLAGGATDIAGVLELMTGTLAAGEVEDVVVTLSDHYYLIRPLEEDGGRPLLLLVALERPGANLALARHEIRDCTSRLG